MVGFWKCNAGIFELIKIPAPEIQERFYCAASLNHCEKNVLRNNSLRLGHPNGQFFVFSLAAVMKFQNARQLMAESQKRRANKWPRVKTSGLIYGLFFCAAPFLGRYFMNPVRLADTPNFCITITCERNSEPRPLYAFISGQLLV